MNRTVLTMLAVATLGLAVSAPPAFAGQQKKGHPAPAKKAPAVTQYECQKCHMKYPAAEAKKDHYIDPMDGGKLTAVKPSAPKKGTPKMDSKMKM